MTRNYDPIFDEIRKYILKRDKYKCQICSSKKRRFLQIHHIICWADSPSLRYEKTNLITLCGYCHSKKVTKNENHWRGILQEIALRNEDDYTSRY